MKKLSLNCKKLYPILFIFSVFLVSTCSLSSQISVEQSRSVQSFIDMVGVSVHLSYGDTAYGNYDEIIKSRLQELGIHHIRDGISLDDLETQEKLKDLAELSIKSTLVIDPRDEMTPDKAVTLAKLIPDSLEAVEGPNEWDLNPELQYGGKNFPEGVRQFQSELYKALKDDPATNHLEILSPSLGRPQRASDIRNLQCEVGNMHSYAGGRMPSHNLDRVWLPSAKILCNSDAIIATECGYHNDKDVRNHQPGVSEIAAAKYISRLFPEYFNRGIKRAYIYELIDLKPDPNFDRHNWHYGLLNNDGSPKPSFLALKNLVTLLQETTQDVFQPFSPQSLNYTISGNTENIHHTLLQKRNGTFYLMLWQEVSSYDLRSKEDIRVLEKDLVVTLNTSISQAKTYQPLHSVEALEQYSNPSQINLQIPDHLLILELVPNKS
ncbi:hypothetical protein H6G89_01500 [Oscillatoria sp. FACHB-1407]|uniref:hypothetical protein n=1 Tax=Oscillatoria sp. FACHB-1407 TaxID=2692847 RepID=UPI0016895DE9|nr:hypothetical protein [Oscillatoria sp. FACHB-1407]MBD2459706.1 hypothetical protein [Oscillatoria sp. FACHB-1407]